MENEAQSIAPITQHTIQTTIPLQSTPKKTNWLKIILFAFIELLFLTGAVYAGIQIGKNQTPIQEPIVTQPTISPTQTAINSTGLPLIPSPTTDSTADWKTYINSTYDFSIDYPNEWISKKYDSTDPRIPFLYNPDNRYEIQFIYYKDQPNIINEMTGKPDVVDLSGLTQTTINNLVVFINSNFQGNDGYYTEYYFQINKGEYIGALAPLSNGPEEKVWSDSEISLAKQIISTFKKIN